MAKGRIEKGDIVAEGILKDFNKDLKTATDNVNLLTTALKAVQETGKALKKGVSTVKPKDVKTIQEFNALTTQSNANAKNRLQVDKSLLTAKEKLKQAQSAQNKAIKIEVALGDKQINTLEKLRARNQAIKIAKDQVNFSTKKGQGEIKKLNAELDRNNKVLQKNASALGKQKMNIGNYKSAISGLRSGLAQLGLSMGVFQILKGSFNIVKDFEQGQADLASVLGINVNEMAALTAQAKELGATTTFTATQVSELQKEYAKLGFSMTEIEAVTEATLSLAEATGTDLGRAAEVTGATIRGFGLSADETQRVVDVMAKSFSSSSLDMEKFATAMSAVAPVAKNAGFSIEQTTALIGTLTDRGIDASSAGTGLRNMFLDAKKNGLSFNEALEQVNGATDKTAKSFELFGKRGATLGVILAENGSSVDSLTGKLKDSDGAAKKMADTQRNTLGGAIALLTSAWEGWILKMNEAGGAGEKLRKAISFIADNFETIVYWVGLAVKSFIAFKVAMKAMQLSSFVTKLGGVGNAFKEVGRGAKSSITGIQGMSKALKGVGFGIAITLLIELAKGLYDAASGAKLFREELEKFDAFQKGSNKRLNDKLKGQEAELKATLDLIDANKELSESEKSEQKLKAINKTTNAFNKQIISLRQTREILIMGLKTWNDLEKTQGGLNIKQEEERRHQKRMIKANLEQIETIRGVRDGVKSHTEEIEKNTDAQNDNNASTTEQVSLLREIIDEEIKLSDSERIRERRTLIENAERRIEDLNGVIANEEEKARLTLLIRENLTKQLNEIDNRKVEGKAKPGMPDSPEPLNELVDITPEDLGDMEEKKFQIQTEYIDLLTNYFIEQADRRIAKIDEEIDAATKQADHYRTLAENGNITAKESLAEQNRLIAEANIQKEQEEKRKQRIQMASAIITAFNTNLNAGDSSGEAFAKAVTSTTLLTQFISALPTFLEGTEDTGAQGHGVDGKGGFNAILHPNERVMTKEQNAMIGGVSNDYVAQVMEQHRIGNYMDGSVLIAKIDNAELISGLSSLQSEMSEVKKAILNQPRESNNTAEMLSNYMMFENKQTQGGKTTTSRFKVRK